jgi:hypothetical protein
MRFCKLLLHVFFLDFILSFCFFDILFSFLPHSLGSDKILDTFRPSPTKRIATVDPSSNTEEPFSPQKIPNIFYRPPSDIATIEFAERIGIGSFGQVTLAFYCYHFVNC